MKHTVNWVFDMFGFDMFYSVKLTALIVPLEVFAELVDSVCLEV